MRMRRGVAATLAGLLVLALLLALQAVPADASQGRLQTAAPRPGDHAVYAVHEVTAGGAAAEPEDVRVDVLAGDPLVARDGAGRLRAILPFAVDVGADGTPGALWTDAASGQAVARAADAERSQQSWDINRYLGVNVASTDGANEVTVVTQDLAYGAAPLPHDLCGLRHAGQVAAVDLDGRLDAPDCGVSLRFAALERAAGVQAYRFTGTRGGERLDLWLHPEVPYPLQVRTGRDAGHLFVLEGFTAGPAPLAVPDVGPAPASQPIDLAAPTRFGPDLAGVQHPFSIEAAIEAVLANAIGAPTRTAEQEFAAWWAAHPAAFVHGASYSEVSDGDHVLRGWDLALGDPQAGARLRVVLEQAEEDATPVLPWSLTSPSRNNLQVAFESALPPPRAAMPEQVPTIASAMKAWERQRTPVFADDTPTGWGFRLLCASDGAADACTTAHVEVEAGHIRFLTPADPVAEVPGVLAYNAAVDADSQVLRLGAGGEPLGLVTVHRSEVADTGGVVALPDLDPEPATQEGRTIGPVQASPLALGATVAAAGAVALAVLFWPALKAMGAGLFSRIQGPRVLEHPGRAAIVHAIEADPGLHFSELARRTGHAAGALRHHLAKLQAAGLVVARPLGGYVCYFAPGTSRDAGALANAAARSEGARKVLEARQAGIAGVRAIAAHTGLSPSTVSHHLARLRQGVGVGDEATTPAD